MDVAAIDVGTDFVDQVERAITGSDASLVVIGPDWLRLEDVHGNRRLDDPNDHVRTEVVAALASGRPVVPVLVDEAVLPSEGELPDELTALARRQAVELHDETWTQDVEMLIRRLQGKDVVTSRRRFLPLVIGLAVVVVGVAVWQGVRDGSGGDDLTGCPIPDESWTRLDVADGATAREPLEDYGALRYTVVGARFIAESSEWLVLLQVRLHNETEDIPGTNDDHTGFGETVFDALHVDRVSVGEPDCYHVISGDEDLSPDEAANVLVGFQSPIDPTGVHLMLLTHGPQEIVITSVLTYRQASREQGWHALDSAQPTPVVVQVDDVGLALMQPRPRKRRS